MSGTYQVVMGDRGRLVVPIQLRERLRLEPGVPLVMLDTPGGIVILTQEQAKNLVRQDLSGLSLVDDLLAERRSQAAVEDAA